MDNLAIGSPERLAGELASRSAALLDILATPARRTTLAALNEVALPVDFVPKALQGCPALANAVCEPCPEVARDMFAWLQASCSSDRIFDTWGQALRQSADALRAAAQPPETSVIVMCEAITMVGTTATALQLFAMSKAEHAADTSGAAVDLMTRAHDRLCAALQPAATALQALNSFAPSALTEAALGAAALSLSRLAPACLAVSSPQLFHNMDDALAGSEPRQAYIERLVGALRASGFLKALSLAVTTTQGPGLAWPAASNLCAAVALLTRLPARSLVKEQVLPLLAVQEVQQLLRAAIERVTSDGGVEVPPGSSSSGGGNGGACLPDASMCSAGDLFLAHSNMLNGPISAWQAAASLLPTGSRTAAAALPPLEHIPGMVARALEALHRLARGVGVDGAWDCYDGGAVSEASVKVLVASVRDFAADFLELLPQQYEQRTPRNMDCIAAAGWQLALAVWEHADGPTEVADTTGNIRRATITFGSQLKGWSAMPGTARKPCATSLARAGLLRCLDSSLRVRLGAGGWQVAVDALSKFGDFSDCLHDVLLTMAPLPDGSTTPGVPTWNPKRDLGAFLTACKLTRLLGGLLARRVSQLESSGGSGASGNSSRMDASTVAMVDAALQAIRFCLQLPVAVPTALLASKCDVTAAAFPAELADLCVDPFVLGKRLAVDSPALRALSADPYLRQVAGLCVQTACSCLLSCVQAHVLALKGQQGGTAARSGRSQGRNEVAGGDAYVAWQQSFVVDTLHNCTMMLVSLLRWRCSSNLMPPAELQQYLASGGRLLGMLLECNPPSGQRGVMVHTVTQLYIALVLACAHPDYSAPMWQPLVDSITIAGQVPAGSTSAEPGALVRLLHAMDDLKPQLAMTLPRLFNPTANGGVDAVRFRNEAGRMGVELDKGFIEQTGTAERMLKAREEVRTWLAAARTSGAAAPVAAAGAAAAASDAPVVLRLCSNPVCEGFDKLHEKIKPCGGCREVGYCCRDCQIAHWPVHKVDCKRSASASS